MKNQKNKPEQKETGKKQQDANQQKPGNQQQGGYQEKTNKQQDQQQQWQKGKTQQDPNRMEQEQPNAVKKGKEGYRDQQEGKGYTSQEDAEISDESELESDELQSEEEE